MRMKDYPKTSTIVKGSTYLNVDSAAAGTKAIESDDLRKQLMGFTTTDEYFDFLDNILDGAAYRTSIFRGKNLGSIFTDEQKAHIADETFKGFFIGDYWMINNITYRIADMNYWIGTGNIATYTPHLVIVPDVPLLTDVVMNINNTTNGGYAGSGMISGNVIGPAVQKVYDAFGQSNILVHRELFTNAVTSEGVPKGGIWMDSQVDLMNEIMVFGCPILGVTNTGVNNAYTFTVDKSQLALFRLYKYFIEISNTIWWLRDIYNSMQFIAVQGGLYPISAGAASQYAVRPAFGLKG